jgi:hypothetical protein
MKARLTVLAMVGLASLLCGCGTVCNLAGGMIDPNAEPRVYGGVQRDFEVLKKVVEWRPEDGSVSVGNNAEGYLVAAGAALCVGDPILSFVADTLTLPITIPLQAQRNASTKSTDPVDRGGSLAHAGVEIGPPVERLPSVSPIMPENIPPDAKPAATLDRPSPKNDL